MLDYGGPQYKTNHPSDSLPLADKHGHWEAHLLDKGSLDSANEGIPLGAWARTKGERRGIQNVVRTYFDEYSDISFALWIWDVICSAVVYGLIDVLGLVADIMYDIVEFILLLMLDLFPTLIQVITELFLTLWNFGGYLFSIFSVSIGDIIMVGSQFLTNGYLCFSNLRSCQSTEEVYTCCTNQQLWTQAQCGTPFVSLTDTTPLTEFTNDILAGERAFVPADGLTTANDRFTIGVSGANDGLLESVKKVYFLPRNREDWWSWDRFPDWLQAKMTSGTSSSNNIKILMDGKGGSHTGDIWPYSDELDDSVYAQSMQGLYSCTGPGAATTWTCEDKETSYFNTKFPDTGAPFDKSTEIVCANGGNSVTYTDINPKSDTFNTVVIACLRPHEKMHCIREVEYKGFLHLDVKLELIDAEFTNGVRRSLSMLSDATIPESDVGYAANVVGKCQAGCGDETTNEGGASSLDFYGYRTVVVQVRLSSYICF
jgi:hypothetical protein